MAENFNDFRFSKSITDRQYQERHLHHVNCENNYNVSNPLHVKLQSSRTEEFRVTKRRGRPIVNNAARERSRVKTLRSAFLELQRTLPAVPPDTKLSKLDVLVLATTYIAHLMSALQDDGDVAQVFAANGCMHPVKKWPMRTRLYAGILSSTVTTNTQDCQDTGDYQLSQTHQQLPWIPKHS